MLCSPNRTKKARDDISVPAAVAFDTRDHHMIKYYFKTHLCEKPTHPVTKEKNKKKSAVRRIDLKTGQINVVRLGLRETSFRNKKFEIFAEL